jgi:phenylpropionate dioxygenase-like ring-hydroxylating dioxygenase large terminal subunit
MMVKPANSGAPLHLDTWYVAALPHEIGRSPLGRVIAGTPMALYRCEDGRPAAILDRCPHRFAPLHRGRLDGDVLRCAYHGLAFGPSGRCVANPHGDLIAPGMHIAAFPIEERHGLVWVWPGDPARADAHAIPDVSYMTAPGTRTVHSYLAADYRYDILVDNLMDLSHADYLHLGSFSGGAPLHAEMQVREEGGGVCVTRRQYAAPPPPFAAHVAPTVDITFDIRWHPGQVLTFRISVEPAEGLSGGRHVTEFAHIATPESTSRTHYFMSVTRRYDLDDTELDGFLANRQLSVIRDEDGPMLEAVDRAMDGRDLLAMRPVVLPVDTGALRVRKVMKRLLDQQESVRLAEAGDR